MKKLLFGIGMLVSQQAVTQCNITTLGLDSATQHTKLRGMVLDPAGMTAVLKPFLPNGIRPRTIVVSRNDLGGVPVWQRRITHTNPIFDLHPHGIARGSEGEVVVYGEISHSPYGNLGQGAYYTQFAIRLDSLGTLDWARIYMLPDGWSLGTRSEQQEGLVGLPDGTYKWCFQSGDGTRLVQLDSAGIPLTAHLFFTGPDTMHNRRPWRAMLGPDGSMYGCHWSYFDDGYNYGQYADVFKVDPSGTVAWGTRVESYLWMSELFYGQGNYVPMVHNPRGSGFSLDQNGDLLLAAANDAGGGDHFLRFSPTGQLLWENETAGGYTSTRGLTSLPNGDLMYIRATTSQHRLVLGPSTGTGPVQVWSHAYAPEQIWSAPGTLAIALGTAPTAPFAKLALAPDASALPGNCEFVNNTHGAPVLQANPTFPLQVTADTMTIKSWPMSIADSSSMALDVFAICAMNRLSPGFSTSILGGAVNHTGTESGPLTVTCTLPLELTTTSITPAPASIVGNVFTWNVPAGLPTDSYWSFSITALLAPDPLLLGTTLTTTVTVSQPYPETDPNNNSVSVSRVVAGPYDPNNKLARTSTGLSDDVYFQGTDEWIDYTINFQNTGTAPAINVVLVDTLPSLLRVGSLLVTGATHPFRYELSASGVLRFIFTNINLPDSNANEPASHGAVNFRVRPEPGLAPGTLVANRADIFFDFNPAVRTPDSEVWIDFITGVADLADRAIRVFPVPVKDLLTVSLPTDVQPTSLVIRSIDGRTVFERNVRSAIGTIRIPVGDLKPQVYVLTLTAGDGRRQTARFVKE